MMIDGVFVQVNCDTAIRWLAGLIIRCSPS
jgi:hypothetical protein